MTVHDEPDFARVYDEDEIIQIRKGDLRTLLDLATGSMDFGSGFWDDEQTEIAWKIADVLGIDKLLVTPANFVCKLQGKHHWVWNTNWGGAGMWYCTFCHHTELALPDRPNPTTAHEEHVAKDKCASISPTGLFCNQKPGHEPIHDNHRDAPANHWTYVRSFGAAAGFVGWS